MRSTAPFLIAVLLSALPATSQEPKKQEPPPASEYKIPPEEAKKQNPLKDTAAAMAGGRRLYATECALCHGAAGDGKSELAESMKLKLLDYRNPDALKQSTDGELFYIINKGKGQMPGEAGRLKDEQQWQIVVYIRSLAKKAEPAEKKNP